MASTYSDNLRIELQTDGENSTTWGSKTNDNLKLLEDSIADVKTIIHGDTPDYTLTTVNGDEDEARSMVLEIGSSLTADRNVIVPTQTKLYVVKNGTAGGFAVTVKTSAGTGVTIPNGLKELIYCDGNNVVSAIDTLGGLTATIAELNILDGVTTTTTELNYLDITTLGTSENSKVVTQDDSGAIVLGATDGDQTIDIASHDLVDGGLKLAGTLVTASAAELNYCVGVTSAIQDQLDAIPPAYPVGSIFTTVIAYADSAAVVAAIGGTTWEAFGAGKVLIGVDSEDTDFDVVESSTGSAGTGGTKTHTLTEAEMPSHNHIVPHTYGATSQYSETVINWVSAIGTTTIKSGQGESVTHANKYSTYVGGDSSEGDTTAGTTSAHNNVQPYITVYMWKRTA